MHESLQNINLTNRTTVDVETTEENVCGGGAVTH